MKYFFKIKLAILIFIIFITNSFAANINIKARTAILVDYLSDEVLLEIDADKKIYPASMTKIMTAIVVFDLIKKGETTLDEELIITENAWRLSKAGYSSMYIMPNDSVSVEDLLKGAIIVSGNDACLALAEGLMGSEEEFAFLMNKKAEEIGMVNSNFTNSSGINDVDNYSTVRDIAKMSKYLIKNYPIFYEYFKLTEYTWDRTGGDPITQGNRNPLLYKNVGADGLKTGYLAVEKYSLAASLKRNERRLISVGSGFETKNSRSRESLRMLNYGLRNFDTIKISKAEESKFEAEVWLGKKDKIELITKEDLYLTIPKRKKNLIKVYIEYEGPIKAPIDKNQKVAKLNIFFNNDHKKSLDLFASETVKQVNIFSRILKSINFLIWGDV